MKIIIQPIEPFFAGGKHYPQVAGDMFVDDTNVVFMTWAGTVQVVIERNKILAGGILPEDFDLETLKGTDYIFVADPHPSTQVDPNVASNPVVPTAFVSDMTVSNAS